jgi:chromosome partitioning protein
VGEIQRKDETFMILTFLSLKGGVGKTTSGIHFSAVLQEQYGETLFIDGDPNRSGDVWARKQQLPFLVVNELTAPRHVRDAKYKHIVIDTKARPSSEDIESLAEGCDLLIIPTEPDALSLDALIKMIAIIQKHAANKYKVLLTKVPPKPSRDGEDARDFLKQANIPVFHAEISRLAVFKKSAELGVAVKDIPNPLARRAWESYVAAVKEAMA